MSKWYILLLITLIVNVPVCTASAQVFSDELWDGYERAYELNDNRQYLEAYTAIVGVKREMSNQLSDVSIDSVSNAEFEYLCCPVMISVAEIAYKLGLHNEMATASAELKQMIDQYFKRESIDNAEEKRNVMLARLAKVDGGFYYLTGQYDLSERELRRALYYDVYDNNFVYAVRDDLAQLYYKQERYSEALSQIDTILCLPTFTGDTHAEQVRDDVRKEIISQRAICLARLGRYQEALQEIDGILKQYTVKASKQAEYGELLRKKGKILILEYDDTQVYNAAAKKCYEEYLSVEKRYVDEYFVDMSESEREQYWMSEQPFVTDCYRLENKAPELLYDVALFSKSILLQLGRTFSGDMTKEQRRKALSSIRMAWKDVQRAMPNSSVAIEFIKYEKKGEDYVGALVLKKNSATPEFVEISRESDILQYVLSNGGRVEDALSKTGVTTNINALYNDIGVRSIIWKEDLIRAIGDSKTIYFAADGLFHQIAIEYLLPEKLSKIPCYRLTSTRLLTEQHRAVRTDNMLMCGGVNYKMSDDTNDEDEENDEYAYSIMSSMRFSLPPLPGTLSEIDSIQKIRGEHKEDSVVYSTSATETIVKQLMQNYHVVLLATHGYFSGQSTSGTDIMPAATDTQLSQSCLFLSGAEKNIKDGDFNAIHPDGILSAREIAKLDLSNVDLAVMSSCMSGLGYVTPDGVFGLQRGLKVAGVKAVIVSLWEVDDNATSILMRSLYTNLEAGKSLYDSFNEARESLKKAVVKKRYHGRVRTKSFNAPSLYNSFILIDGIE